MLHYLDCNVYKDYTTLQLYIKDSTFDVEILKSFYHVHNTKDIMNVVVITKWKIQSIR